MPGIDYVSADATASQAWVQADFVQFDLSQGHTIEFRASLSVSGGGYADVVGVSSGAADVWFELDASGTLLIDHPYGGYKTTTGSTSGWHLYSLVWDGTNMYLYIDASPEALADASPPASAATRPTPAPQSTDAWAYMTNGTFAELRVWTKSRSARDVLGTLLECQSPQDELTVLVDMTQIPAVALPITAAEVTVSGAYREETLAASLGSGVLNCGSDPSWAFTPNQDFTVEAWIQPSQYSSTSWIATTANQDAYWSLILDPNGYLVGMLQSRTDGTVGAVSSPATIPTGQWTHVAFVHDAGSPNDTYSLYVNGGCVVSSQVKNFTPSGTVGSSLSIGGGWIAYPQRVVAPFYGEIEQVRIWPYALSAAQVAANMQAEAVDDPTATACYAADFGQFVDTSGAHKPPTASGSVWIVTDVVNVSPSSGVRTRVETVTVGEVASRDEPVPRGRAADDTVPVTAQVDALLLATRMVGEPVGLPIVRTDAGFAVAANMLVDSSIASAFQTLVGGSSPPTQSGLQTFFDTLVTSGDLGPLLSAVTNASAQVIRRFLTMWDSLVTNPVYEAVIESVTQGLQAAWSAAVATIEEPEDEVELTIDVYQARWGDTIVVQSSYTAGSSPAATWSMLVDGGPTGRNFRTRVLPSLPNVLDVVCATHPDADHVVGLQWFFGEIPVQPPVGTGQVVRAAWLNAPPTAPSTDDPLYAETFDAAGDPRPEVLELDDLDDDPRFHIESWRQLYNLGQLAQGRSVPVSPIQYGTPPVQVNPHLSISYRGPYSWNLAKWVTAGSKSLSSELSNRTSIIMDFTSDLATNPVLLMTGDAWDVNVADSGIGVPAGNMKTDIRGNPPPPPPPIRYYTFMKVPHHGSKDSDDATFYARFLADYYLVSAGAERHDLPTYDTLKNIVIGNAQVGRKGWSIYVTNRTDKVNKLATDSNYGPQVQNYNLFALRPMAAGPGGLGCRMRFRAVLTAERGLEVVELPVPGVEVDRLP